MAEPFGLFDVIFSTSEAGVTKEYIGVDEDFVKDKKFWFEASFKDAHVHGRWTTSSHIHEEWHASRENVNYHMHIRLALS